MNSQPLALGLALVFGAGLASAQVDLDQVDLNHDPVAEHVDQDFLNSLVLSGDPDAFITAFDLGDELFEFDFNALDGGGANVGNGQRFTRLPRADLAGPGQWASHVPARATGPNGSSCIQCHNKPVADGAGDAALNVIRDPLQSGQPSKMINRNTPHLHGSGALQNLAEEMTADLLAIRDEAIEAAEDSGAPATRTLTSKGVNFGRITAIPVESLGGDIDDIALDTSRVRGVSTDLHVRPYQWKGNFLTLRDFNRDASHQELGMQSVENTGLDVDGDGDGVANELTVGDQTALTVYLAAQPRPLTRRELASVGVLPPIPPAELMAIERGEVVFRQVGCARCHIPNLPLANAIFSEPSQAETHRDEEFPTGDDPEDHGLSPDTAVTFDLTADQPDNRFPGPGGTEIHLGAFPTDGAGNALINLYGDLKWHNMGPGLAESIDEAGNGRSVWLTKELWGVGATAPYLHDGRATTLTEAIQWHGGESTRSRNLFFSRSASDQAALIAFLNDLTIFLPDEEE